MASAEMVNRRAWLATKRVIAVYNGKGGVGKTTLSAILAYMLWKLGLRVLVLDFNSQGNYSRREVNLFSAGTKYDADGELRSVLDDDGDALFAAIVTGKPFDPIEVPDHPGLFLGHGGEQIGKLFKYIGSLPDKDKVDCINRLMQAMESDVDVIIYDTPPENPDTTLALFAATHYAVFSAKTDGASLEDGLKKLGRQFAEVKENYNPYLTLLGGVLFATQLKAPRLAEPPKDENGKLITDPDVIAGLVREAVASGAHETLRDGKPWLAKFAELQTLLGDGSLACPQHVPMREGVGNMARDYRMNVIELEALAVAENWPAKLLDPIVAASAAWAAVGDFLIDRLLEEEDALNAGVPAQGGVREVVS